MNKDQILAQLQNLTIWKRGKERAPHKPLVLLLAISRFLNQGQRSLAYAEDESVLRSLLQEFGPYRKTYHTNYPFWRLENDGIWVLDAPDFIRPEYSGSGDIKKSDLIKYQVHGGFRPDILELFQQEPSTAYGLIDQILNEHFPETLHEEIRSAIGLPEEGRTVSRKRRRDPNFRNQVLEAYRYQCAICGFQVMLRKTPLALEASHIQWHQHHGPDTVENGLALCSIHHKLLDNGAFTINSYGIIQVSELAYGNHGFDQWLGKYHDQSMRAPVRSAYEPRAEYLTWHQKEVFKGQPQDTFSGSK